MFEGIRFLNIEYYFDAIADFFATVFGGIFGVRPDTGTVDFYNTTHTGALSVSQNSGNAFHVFLFLVGFGCFVGILYYLYLSYEIRLLEVSHVEHWMAHETVTSPERNPRLDHWEKIVALFNSSDHTQWRLAIIESDTMLDELLQYIGFEGVNLGERLKSASIRVFPPLHDAWEVHNLRNRIAHEGLTYELSQEDSIRARKIYENIFRGYNFI